jgi:hypothetical protein
MNKILTTVGLTALGAASLQAQYAPGLTPLEMTKAWSLSADLRGFYDDNYLTLPKNSPFGPRLASWGTEVSPSAAINHSVENTLMSASYIYDLRWYEKHSTDDSSHQFNGRIEHEFSERYKLSVSESFVVAQEPTVIDPSIISSPLRVEGNNVRNTGQVDFTAGLTKDFDLHLGYGNTLYAYQQTARSVVGYPFSGAEAGYFPEPSRSAMLDRMEQLGTLDLRWKATPETTGILGYQFGHTDYTSPEYIIFPGSYGAPPYTSPGYLSNSRNSDSHFFFVGADESFTPTLNGSIRVGGEYLDYYNFHTSRLSPYVDASLTDQYMPGCSGQLGVKHIHNSTDVVGSTGTTPVLDEDTTAVYISDSHKLTDRLTGTVMGQVQLSTFNGGGAGYNGETEQFYILEINLAYHFSPWLLTEAGYNYSNLRSDLPFRAYTRDFMYLGVRATY